MGIKEFPQKILLTRKLEQKNPKRASKREQEEESSSQLIRDLWIVLVSVMCWCPKRGKSVWDRFSVSLFHWFTWLIAIIRPTEGENKGQGLAATHHTPLAVKPKARFSNVISGNELGPSRGSFIMNGSGGGACLGHFLVLPLPPN